MGNSASTATLESQVVDTHSIIPEDPPPPYESLSSGSTPTIIQTDETKRSQYQPVPLKLLTWRHEQPLRFYRPDPKRVMCHCRRQVDTTLKSSTLPDGSSLCYCGYIVTSSGCAYYPTTPRDDGMKRCTCGAFLPTNMNGKNHLCDCGAVFEPNGSVIRLCGYHQRPNKDARNVRCLCGRYVDTIARYTIRHGSTSTRNMSGSSAGYACYDYDLERDAGRCACGMTVWRNADCVLEHSNECCRILKADKGKFISIPEDNCNCCSTKLP